MTQRKEARYRRAVERNLSNAEKREHDHRTPLLMKYSGMSMEAACRRLGVRLDTVNRDSDIYHRVFNLTK